MIKRSRTRRQSARELQFARLWATLDKTNRHPFVAEHRFDQGRLWRFDFAWPTVRVAVEIEGGTYSRRRSRHTTGSGHQSDCEKYNAAAIAGWCVLKYTSKDLEERPVQICREIAGAIESRERTSPTRGWA